MNPVLAENDSSFAHEYFFRYVDNYAYIIHDINVMATRYILLRLRGA